MNKLNAVKTVAGLVVSLGVGAIVGNAIKATTPDDIKTVSKVIVGIGSFAVAGYLATKASEQTETTVQEIADQVSKAISSIKAEAAVDSQPPSET